MSDHTDDAAARAAKIPRLSIETSPASDAEFDDEPTIPALDANDDLRNAVGFIKGLGAAVWKYAYGHPFTVTYGFTGLVLAVLILLIGLWDTIVIAVFVVVGAMIGQIRDGDNGIVNFFSRIFNGRR